MATFTGFAGLRTPKDLLSKLEYDLSRMIESPGSTYAAFDFFVTAEHMLDWVYPDRSGRKQREEFRTGIPLLAVTSHLANGGKHFVASAGHHNSVQEIENQSYADEYVDSDYVDEWIEVEFTPDEAQHFGATTLDAISLAKQVFSFWSAELSD